MTDPFFGEIRPLAFSWAPVDWALCNGAVVPLAQYQALAAVIGTQFGGNGQTTIGLPNLQGRAALGAGNGPGLTSRSVGSSGGTAAVTLTPSQMAPHQHSINGEYTGVAADIANVPSGTVTLSRTIFQSDYSTTDIDPWVTTTGFDPATIGVTGGVSGATQAHNNMQPWLCINFVICTNGIWPERP